LAPLVLDGKDHEKYANHFKTFRFDTHSGDAVLGLSLPILEKCEPATNYQMSVQVSVQDSNQTNREYRRARRTQSSSFLAIRNAFKTT
jgi:hypothetical protein